jgi:hypothetical protein
VLSPDVKRRWTATIEQAYTDIARWYARQQIETLGGLLDFGDAKQRAYKTAGQLLDRAAQWVDSPDAVDARADAVLTPLVRGAYDVTTGERFLGLGDFAAQVGQDVSAKLDTAAEVVSSRATWGGLGLLLGAGVVLWLFSSSRR